MGKRGPKRKPVLDRLWAKVDKSGPVPEHRPDLGPCWLWTGPVGRGYGIIHIYDGNRATKKSVHLVMYENYVGAIIKPNVIDHLCDNKVCVNPDHLNQTTRWKNIQRSRGNSPVVINSTKTHCKRGHEFTEDNTRIDLLTNRGPKRTCRKCDAMRRRLRYLRNKEGKEAYA